VGKIVFRKVIGTPHTGVQALTCHRLAGMFQFKEYDKPFGSRPETLKSSLTFCTSYFHTVRAYLTVFLVTIQVQKMKVHDRDYNSLTFGYCISIFLSDTT
jgi:hypothetical protein